MSKRAVSGIVMLLMLSMLTFASNIQSVKTEPEEYPPEPFIAYPYNCSLIYGNTTEISAVEMHLATNIVSTTFEYSIDGLNWAIIDVDLNFTGGWRTLWNLTDLSEGHYYIRATMVDNMSQVGRDMIHIYFDPTPPIPEMPAPTFPTFVRGYINLTATTMDENVICATFYRYYSGWMSCETYEKPVAKLKQHNIDDQKNPQLNDPFNGAASCGPTAAASCLAYWDAYVAPDGSRPYDNLYNDRPWFDNDGDGYHDGLEEMARELYRRARTNQDDDGDGKPDPGTNVYDLRDAITTYAWPYFLETRWIAKRRPTFFQPWFGIAEPDEISDNILIDLINAFLYCQDVIAFVDGHFVTISSVHLCLESVDYIWPPKRPITSIWIDYMDPWTGTTSWGIADLENDLIDNKLVSHIITVCPDPRFVKGAWVPCGTDFDGSDGWSVSLDTTQLPDGFYIVKSDMTDATNNTGTDIILVYVNNARITDITPTKTVVTEGTPIDIQVSVENMFVGPGFFNVTLYGNETLIGTKNVLLPSQTSTMLVFTWDTHGLPKGNYVISANASILLNETYLTHITYIDGEVLVTSPPPLSASISPLSASILVGRSVTFTSTVSGGYPPYSYQWYLNGNPVSGATSNTWTFTPTASGIYYAHLIVTDDKGNTAQSDVARITVATVPVGGYSIPIQAPATATPLTPYLILTAILTIAFTTIKRKTTNKTKKPP